METAPPGKEVAATCRTS